MNEQNNKNGRGIFYGVIGVATLVVAIIGATFAYFTATAGNNVITGNMATVSLSLDVVKMTTVDETKGGMIPMSNNMVDTAVSSDTNQVCVDDNGNAVCQVYKITVTNDSSTGQFVDGYVALKGGSGIEPTDVKGLEGVLKTDGTGTLSTYTYVDEAKFDAKGTANQGTTMRWIQVFDDTSGVYTGGTETDYNTSGTMTLGPVTSGDDADTVAIALLANNVVSNAPDYTHNRSNIRTNNTMMKVFTNDGNKDGVCTTTAGDNPLTAEVEDNYVENNCTSDNGDARGILSSMEIAGNDYDVIGTNFIRTSNHAWNANGGKESYSREKDATSALVYSHNIAADGTATYYIVVWLSETGTNQTAGATVGPEGSTYVNPSELQFFKGNVTFVSAQGSEVSATFSSYTRVEATDY